MKKDLRAILEATREKHGKLTDEALVSDARDEAHECHERIWGEDDDTAAYKHRLQVARDIIREVHYTFTKPTGETVKVRAYESVRRDGTFEPSEQIAEDPFSSQIMQRMMEREWKALHQRWSSWGEFVEMVRRDIA